MKILGIEVFSDGQELV